MSTIEQTDAEWLVEIRRWADQNVERIANTRMELLLGFLNAERARADAAERQIAALSLFADRLEAQCAELRTAIQRLPHRRDCQINPGGRIMEAFGDPTPRPCSCGRDAALSRRKEGSHGRA